MIPLSQHCSLKSMVMADGDIRRPQRAPICPIFRGSIRRALRRFQGWPELEALYRKFGDPTSDGGDNWVDLRPYHPSLLPSLKESRTAGSPTKLVFMNVTQEEVLVYEVKRDGREELWIRIPPDLRYIRWRPSKTNDIWLIKDANSRNLAVFLPEQRTGRALIGGAPLITPGLSKISGDNQGGVSSTVLANPFVIEVRDENGLALEGISVTFIVTAGGGTLSTIRATTDKMVQHRVRSRWE